MYTFYRIREMLEPVLLLKARGIKIEVEYRDGSRRRAKRTLVPGG